MSNEQQTPSNRNNKKDSRQNYVRYSSVGIQAAITILIGVFGGLKLDSYFEFEKPILTAILSIVAVFVAMYFLIKELQR